MSGSYILDHYTVAQPLTNSSLLGGRVWRQRRGMWPLWQAWPLRERARTWPFLANVALPCFGHDGADINHCIKVNSRGKRVLQPPNPLLALPYLRPLRTIGSVTNFNCPNVS